VKTDHWVKAFLEKLGIGNTLTPRWSYPPRRTTQLYYEMFHTSPRLDALKMLAEDVAAAQFKMFDKKKYKFDKDNADPIQEHPIYDILENPMPNNLELDGFVLSFLTEVYLNLIGEAFWVMERANNGIPAEVYPIPPNWMLQTPTTNVPYYLIVPLGNTSHKPLPVDPKDVIWFKEPDIVSPFGRGRARTEAIGDELESDEFAAKYAKNYFYNDATPPLIIEAPGATPDAVERFKESWMQKVGGFLNARKPGVIPWKDSKITKLADSAREMDFVESRKFLRDVCNQHWAQPPELSGILENSNRSTIDSAYYLWTKNVVSKRLMRKQAVLNRQFVPQFDKTVTLVFDNVVPDDAAFDLQVATTGLNAGTITVDEWRHINKKAPLPNGRGDVLLRPFNISEISLDKSEPVQEPVAPAKPESAIEETIPEVPPKKIFKSAFNDEARSIAWKMFDRRATSGEKAFKDAVHKTVERQRKVFKKAIRNNGDIDAAVSIALRDTFTKDEDKALESDLSPAWLQSMKHGYNQATETLAGKAIEGVIKKDGVSASWDIVNPKMREWIDTNGLLKAEGINDVTEDKLRKAIAATIAEGLDSGENINQLRNRILDATDGVYDDMDVVRANNIARTETCATVNFGQVTTYKEDNVEQKEWLSSQDDRTRDDHQIGEGWGDPYVVGIDEDFEIGGDMMQAPGLGSDPAENCNCRCTILPVIPEGD
jgi:HK97 family phage portal protein